MEEKINGLTKQSINTTAIYAIKICGSNSRYSLNDWKRILTLASNPLLAVRSH